MPSRARAIAEKRYVEDEDKISQYPKQRCRDCPTILRNSSQFVLCSVCQEHVRMEAWKRGVVPVIPYRPAGSYQRQISPVVDSSMLEGYPLRIPRHGRED